MNNVFYFISKPLFVFKDIYICVLTLLVISENSLIRKVNFKIHDIITQTITINILPDISKCKDNQIMKFGQLIE